VRQGVSRAGEGRVWPPASGRAARRRMRKRKKKLPRTLDAKTSRQGPRIERSARRQASWRQLRAPGRPSAGASAPMEGRGPLGDPPRRVQDHATKALDAGWPGWLSPPDLERTSLRDQGVHRTNCGVSQEIGHSGLADKGNPRRPEGVTQVKVKLIPGSARTGHCYLTLAVRIRSRGKARSAWVGEPGDTVSQRQRTAGSCSTPEGKAKPFP
jgi:hypothetical protein